MTFARIVILNEVKDLSEDTRYHGESVLETIAGITV